MSLLLPKFLHWIVVWMNNISVPFNIIVIVSFVLVSMVTINENIYCDATATTTSTTHPSRFGANNNLLYKRRDSMIKKSNRSINNEDFFSSNKISTTTKMTLNSPTTMATTNGSCCQVVGRGGSTTKRSNEKFRSISDNNDSSDNHFNHHYRRRACSLYIWNAPSALLYKWCCHLQRDNIYEGRGGRKFVRIQPGSMLQLLYPCTRYSVDKCLFCGGTFHDHLLLWWSKHLYTPFDRYLDRVRNVGEVVTTESALTNTAAEQHSTTIMNNSNKRKFNRIKKLNHQSIDQPQYDYRYHHRYVLDITTLLETAKDRTPHEKKELILRTLTERYQTILPSRNVEQMEQRSWRPHFNQPAIQYVVPNYDESNSAISNAFSESKAILQMARFVCLNAIDRLLDIQYLDSRRTNKKQL